MAFTSVKRAKTLDADADELLLIAKVIPAQIKKRVLERPDAFRTLADLGEKARDRVLKDGGRRAGISASMEPHVERVKKVISLALRG